MKGVRSVRFVAQTVPVSWDGELTEFEAPEGCDLWPVDVQIRGETSLLLLWRKTPPPPPETPPRKPSKKPKR